MGHRASRGVRHSANTPPPTLGRAAARPAPARGAPPAGTTVATDTGSARIEYDRDDPRLVTLYVNDVPSSAFDLDDPHVLPFEYLDQMATVLRACPPGPIRAAHLGAGACALARHLDAARPGSRQVAVDIDRRLTELVREWFDLPRAPRLRLRVQDARDAVRSPPVGGWDVVVRDAFEGTRGPAHLTTVEFAAEVLAGLRPGGLYLANCADRPPLELARREMASLAAALVGRAPGRPHERAGRPAGAPESADPAWTRLALIAETGVLRGRRYGNLVLVAVAPAGAARADPEPALDPAHPALARALRCLPVPARLITGPELAAFVGSSAPLRDAMEWVANHPAIASGNG